MTRMALSGAEVDLVARRSRHRPAELVLDLSIGLDLINSTHPCQGRRVSLTYSSCALILGAARKADDRKDSYERVHRHPHPEGPA